MAEEKQNVTIACNAVGQPRPSITWSKSVGSLPKDRTEVRNGTLKIYSLAREDSGIFICKAENTLGSATYTAHLVVFTPLKFKVRPPQEVTLYPPLYVPCTADSFWECFVTDRGVDQSALLSGVLLRLWHTSQKLNAMKGHLCFNSYID